ncbi:hypothetical protein OG735_20040 [Streptomyces sp. NBC_01210]|uniref:DUF7144 family membrane protein n=1 Tax=Streptomyces sp. NBC_01210 TaxID=2903774 RepID=UPI002E114CB4|nr:hypothetical protein OG735_20040 [Streptomyces sp. NBC_01210]
MSQTTHPRSTHDRSEASLAAAGGLVVFAAVMLIIGGILDVFRGIMAIANDDIFVSTPRYVFRFDVTGWGWLHLILGVVAILVGVSLFKAPLWARIIGIVIAALLIITNFLSLPYYPFWSVIAIALYAFIIWALCVVRPDEMTG